VSAAIDAIRGCALAARLAAATETSVAIPMAPGSASRAAARYCPVPAPASTTILAPTSATARATRATTSAYKLASTRLRASSIAALSAFFGCGPPSRLR
jgi:hypothetical protein